MGPINDNKLVVGAIKDQIIQRSKHHNELPPPINDVIINSSSLENVLSILKEEREKTENKVNILYEKHYEDINDLIKVSKNLKSQHENYYDKMTVISQQILPLKSNGIGEPQNLVSLNKSVEAGITQKKEKVYQMRKRVEAMKFLNGVHDLHKKALSFIQLSDFQNAVKCLLELKALLEVDRVENSSLVIVALKEKVQHMSTQLAGVITNTIEKNIQLEHTKVPLLSKITLSEEASDSDPLSLNIEVSQYNLIEKLLDSLQKLDQLDIYCKEISTFLWRRFWLIMVGDKAYDFELKEDGIKKIVLEKRIVKETDLSKRLNIKFNEVLLLLKFLVKSFGSFLIPHFINPSFYEAELSPLLVKNLLKVNLPTSRHALKEFEKLETVVDRFESQIKGLCKFKVSTPGPLTQFVRKGNFHYLNKRKLDILNMVREVLKEDQFGVIEVGQGNLLINEIKELQDINVKRDIGHLNINNELIELPLLFPNCKVPDTIPRIIVTIEAILSEACQVDYDSANQLYLMTREALELYLTLQPIRLSDKMKHKKDSNAIEYLKTTALLHNEIFYLAHQLLSLNLRFSSLYLKYHQQKLNYLDFVPKLITLAHHQLSIPLNNYLTQSLQPLIDLGNNGFRDLDKPINFKNLKESLNASLKVCETLKLGWSGILPPRTFETLVGGSVLVPLTNHILDEILSLIDIGENESYALQKGINPFIVFLQETLPHTIIQGTCIPIKKLELLSYILTASLKDINYELQKGTYRGIFNSNELIGLIEALFGDSDNRTRLLRQLKKNII